MACDLDVLCMGSFVLRKHAQKAWVPFVSEVSDKHDEFEDILCPCGSGGKLQQNHNGLVGSSCGHRFPVTDGIPQVYWPHDAVGDPGDVTERVKAFYEKTPFPNYNGHDSARSLIESSRRGIYARALDEAIPYNSSVLEVGCGTGQLSNFLGISCRRVTGVDLCLNSLRLAERFRSEQSLKQVRFLQINLFRPPFQAKQFDVILCNGVLHHTSDPYGGFKGLLPLLRPGGYIVIGLYNKYGRLMTDTRRAIFRMTKGAGKWIDPYLRSSALSQDKRQAWFADQYQHPHESKHTIGEVLRWFDENGLEFVSGVPAVSKMNNNFEEEGLFNPAGPGSRWSHFLVQARQIAAGSREGGFFVMIGRRPTR